MLFLQERQQLAESGRPTSAKVYVLSLSYQERRLIRLESKRDYECIILECSGDFGRNLYFISNTLFVDRDRICDQEHFQRSIAKRQFQLSLPVLSSTQPQNVGPYFIT